MKTNFGEHMLNQNSKYFSNHELRLMTHGTRKQIKDGSVKIPSSFNFNACDFFRELDLYFNTNGLYADNGGEQRIKVPNKKPFYIDYCNHSLRLVINWNEEFQYKRSKFRAQNIKKRFMVQKAYPNYLFLKLEEKEVLRNKEKFFIYIKERLKIDPAPPPKR